MPFRFRCHRSVFVMKNTPFVEFISAFRLEFVCLCKIRRTLPARISGSAGCADIAGTGSGNWAIGMKKSYGADIMFPARVAVFRGAGRGENRTLRSLPLFRNRPEDSNRIADRNFSNDGGVSACFCSTDATAPTEFALRVVCPGCPPPVAGSSYNPFAATLRASCSVAFSASVNGSGFGQLPVRGSAVAFTANNGSADVFRSLPFRNQAAVSSAPTGCRGVFSRPPFGGKGVLQCSAAAQSCDLPTFFETLHFQYPRLAASRPEFSGLHCVSERQPPSDHFEITLNPLINPHHENRKQTDLFGPVDRGGRCQRRTRFPGEHRC